MLPSAGSIFLLVDLGPLYSSDNEEQDILISLNPSADTAFFLVDCPPVRISRQKK
jgi:hypothetical protein